MSTTGLAGQRTKTQHRENPLCLCGFPCVPSAHARAAKSCELQNQLTPELTPATRCKSKAPSVVGAPLDAARESLCGLPCIRSAHACAAKSSELQNQLTPLLTPATRCKGKAPAGFCPWTQRGNRSAGFRRARTGIYAASGIVWPTSRAPNRCEPSPPCSLTRTCWQNDSPSAGPSSWPRSTTTSDGFHPFVLAGCETVPVILFPFRFYPAQFRLPSSAQAGSGD